MFARKATGPGQDLWTMIVGFTMQYRHRLIRIVDEYAIAWIWRGAFACRGLTWMTPLLSRSLAAPAYSSYKRSITSAYRVSSDNPGADLPGRSGGNNRFMFGAVNTVC